MAGVSRLTNGVLLQVPLEQQLHAFDFEGRFKELLAVSRGTPSVPLGLGLGDALLERGDFFLQGHRALFRASCAAVRAATHRRRVVCKATPAR